MRMVATNQKLADHWLVSLPTGESWCVLQLGCLQRPARAAPIFLPALAA